MTKMPKIEARQHAAEHRRADRAPAGRAGADGDHERQQAEDEGEARHHHRAESKRAPAIAASRIDLP